MEGNTIPNIYLMAKTSLRNLSQFILSHSMFLLDIQGVQANAGGGLLGLWGEAGHVDARDTKEDGSLHQALGGEEDGGEVGWSARILA